MALDSNLIVRICELHSGLTGLIDDNMIVEVNGIKHEFDKMWSRIRLIQFLSKGKAY